MRTLLLGLVMLLTGLSLADDSVQIKVLENGMGSSVAEGQEAVISYRLTLEDGTFVDGRDKLKPLRFEVGSESVIPGMSQGVLGMKVGERRELRVPPSLAYGQDGYGPLPPGATLVFEVELLEIQDEASTNGLSDQMKDDDFLATRHARNISKPAIFEYLIRDFFTKPWRYSDGHIKLWKETAKLVLVFLALLLGYTFGKKRGFFIP